MWWNNIVSWFQNLGERSKCVNDFNKAAQAAFISNIAPVYMKADISRGNRSYRHAMSDWLFSGFRKHLP